MTQNFFLFTNIVYMFMNANGQEINEHINKLTDKMWCIYNVILLSHEKDGNPAIRDNIVVPWEHYAMCIMSEKDK